MHRKHWLFAIPLMLMLASPALGLPALGDVGKRLTLSANGSGMWLAEQGGASTWRGADLGGAVTLNLHQMLSVYVAYDHGFPFKGESGHLNFMRAMANLRVYPQIYTESKQRLFIGFGHSWWGAEDVTEAKSYEAQIVGTHELASRVYLFAMYSHGFAVDADAAPGRNFAKVGLNLKIAP
jgi:hypothetical protein